MNIHDQLYCKAHKSKKPLDWVLQKCKQNFEKKKQTKSNEPRKKLYLQRIKGHFQ